MTPPCHRLIVAVKAEKVISSTALAWALSHLARPADCVTLLAVLSDHKEKRSFWRFRRLNGGGCRSTEQGKLLPDRIGQILESCSQMVLQFDNQIQVRVRIKVESLDSAGIVASEVKNIGASWLVLDKKLKQECKVCMEELHCNIVLMNGSRAKVLKLNLGNSEDPQTPFFSAPSSPALDGKRMKHSAPVNSPEDLSTSNMRTSIQKEFPTPDTGTPIFLVYERNPLYEGLDKGNNESIQSRDGFGDSFSAADSVGERTITLSRNPAYIFDSDKKVFWIPQNHIVDKKVIEAGSCRNIQDYCQSSRISNSELSHKHSLDYENESSIREAVSLESTPSMPPPLCSLCQNKAPSFGKPPRQFYYDELEEATNWFSDSNFLAEGGFGSVHKGVLRDGQVVAVKQLKFGGLHGDADFCREVRVLSCAQHRNVVLLIGFCVEGNKRLLVYEYICNGSLAFHLDGNKKKPLDWSLRLKIAIGTARGLRYLHEDCRVGCIVHRDLRPNNVLLTHDFEPQVADFGIARLHTEWLDEEQVVGTSGYLAPEYFCGGKLTEKVDTYSFGLVLLELITGRKNSDFPHNGVKNLLKNIYTLVSMEQMHLVVHRELVPHRPCQLRNLPHELQLMYRAASLCLQQDPDLRPSMSKVLKILEGFTIVPLALDLKSIGSRSAHLQGLNSEVLLESRKRHSRMLSH